MVKRTEGVGGSQSIRRQEPSPKKISPVLKHAADQTKNAASRIFKQD